MDGRIRSLIVVFAAGLVVTAVTSTSLSAGSLAGRADPASHAGTVPAPEFPRGLDWLNSAAPLTLKELRGKVVVVDFWTYGCINCMHDFPWVKKLEADFPDTLVVVGVHSAKFSEEGNTRNIREIILRYGLDYPVINDSQFQVWNQWEVSAWPTLAVVDPAGNVVIERAGEGFYPEFNRIIASLVEEFGAKGLFDLRPLKLRLEKEGLPQTMLSFPGRVRVDAKGTRLFISDTDHNRIVVAALDSGQVLAVIGSGKQGFEDGDDTTVEFHHPQGTALSADGKTLYVVDTGNSSLRQVDLVTHRVTTLAGTGAQASEYPPAGGTAPGVALSSPWDLTAAGHELYIAMAGCHQIWRMDLETKRITAYAGTGAEGYDDGPLDRATLAQPSGLTIGRDGRIYFADSEGSSIRFIDPASRRVVTLAGAGDSLFHFGDGDGIGRHARFQHPLGVVAYAGKLYVADTYNSKIRVVDPKTGEVKTLCGGKAGWRDGKNPLFYEPGGIDAANGTLYVADTNNHSIRAIELASGVASTFVLKGLSMLSAGDVYGGKVVEVQPLMVTPGKGLLRLSVEFPAGFGPNPQAPSEVVVKSSAGDAVSLPGPTRFNGAGPSFPMVFPAVFTTGRSAVTVDLSLVYCQEERASVCLIKQVRLEVPVQVETGAGTGAGTAAAHPVLDVRYRIQLAAGRS
jgi:DNA-binding beta-propeller fold protein YncE